MRRSLLSLTLGAFLMCAVSTSAKAQDLSAINDVLGGIANTYGSFQAAQFVASLFGIGAGPDIATAVTELETFMRSYRDQELVQNVASDLTLFQMISENYQSGLTDDLEANFITFALRDLTNIQGDIQNGTMADAYLLAPAYNLLSVLYPSAVKAFGIQNPANAYPQSYLDSFLTTAFSVDYGLVGALIVVYDVLNVNGYSVLAYTQGGKTMWPKYAGAYFSLGSAPCTSNGYYYCNNTLAPNADSDLFLSCTCFAGDRLRTVISPAPLTAAALTGAQTLINNNRSRFTQDSAVQPIIATMRSILGMGLASEIVDWNNGTLGIPGFGHVLFSL
jgi:hypothetical protein